MFSGWHYQMFICFLFLKSPWGSPDNASRAFSWCTFYSRTNKSLRETLFVSSLSATYRRSRRSRTCRGRPWFHWTARAPWLRKAIQRKQWKKAMQKKQSKERYAKNTKKAMRKQYKKIYKKIYKKRCKKYKKCLAHLPQRCTPGSTWWTECTSASSKLWSWTQSHGIAAFSRSRSKVVKKTTEIAKLHLLGI